PARVLEPGSDLWSVGTNLLHDYAAIRHDRVDGLLDAVDHDIEEHSRLGRWRAAGYPRPTHLANRIVKGSGAVAALSDRPAEDVLVKSCRAADIGCRNFDVADLAVRERGRHQHS